MSDYQLTYCGNVHPARNLRDWAHAVRRHAIPVADSMRGAGREFGLGTWWNAAVAEELNRNPAALEEVHDILRGHDLQLWTLNAFPYASFHASTPDTWSQGERSTPTPGADVVGVKARVYEPDWSTEERVMFTRHVAEATASLAVGDRMVPISTLPLGYRPDSHAIGREEWRRMARNLVRAVTHLREVEDRTGVHMMLCLEPEPFCMLETVAATADFLENWVFVSGGWTVSEDTLRRHLGVCVDLCHLAVLREDANKVLLDLALRGIEVGKIQVSSALELRDPQALNEIFAFDEPVYLHQTVGQNGARALDLAQVRTRRQEFADAGMLRTHFHMPVFWDSDGPLGSTRAEMVAVLEKLSPADAPLLEVETYTWEVLPEDHQCRRSLTSGIIEELSFVAGILDRA